MKKALIMFLLCCSSLAGFCPENKTIPMIMDGRGIFKPYEPIRRAVGIVESNLNPKAYNKAENAVGMYQIRQIRITDYNRRTGKSYTLEEMYDPIKSEEVFMYYARQIGWRNEEKIIRCWNGGPNGMRINQTKVYYQKVLLYL